MENNVPESLLAGRNWDDLWPTYNKVKAMDWQSSRDVGNIQVMLKDLGYYTDEIDSLGGPNTRKAVNRFTSDVNQKEGLAWYTIKNLGDTVKNLFTGDDDD